MAHYVTKVRTARPVEDVFAYLADLRNFAEWDPGVKAVRQIEGDGGGPSSVFDVTVKGIGKDLTLRYRTIEYVEGRTAVVEASSKLLRSLDRISVEADGTGSVATYDATLTFNGPLSALGGLLGPLFKRIGDRAAAGLRQALGGSAA